MKQNKIGICVLILMLLFMGLPATSAHIGIVDVGHSNAAQWDDIEGMSGFVDYQNLANHTIEGAILVFVDGEIVAGKILNMKIRYVAGFWCSPVRTFEFPITEAKGDHTMVVHIFSMNSSVERAYVYYTEGINESRERDSEGEEEKDWLPCSWMCGDNEGG